MQSVVSLKTQTETTGAAPFAVGVSFVTEPEPAAWAELLVRVRLLGF